MEHIYPQPDAASGISIRESGKLPVRRANLRFIGQIKGIRPTPPGLMPYPSYLTGGFASQGRLFVKFYPASQDRIRFPFLLLESSKQLFRVQFRFLFLKSPEI